MLKPSALIVALFAMFSTSVLAQDLRVCPNVQVGEWDSSASSIYSDCTMEPVGGGDGLHVFMGFVDLVGLEGGPPGDFDPTPVGDVPIGTEYDGLDFVVEDMGPNYTGTCNDMVASIPTKPEGGIPRVDGNVYCARISNIEGNQLWLRGTVDVAGNTWKDPIVLTNQPGVGTPYRPASTVPVPVLPFWGLLSLAGLIGLFGFRKLRA